MDMMEANTTLESFEEEREIALFVDRVESQRVIQNEYVQNVGGNNHESQQNILDGLRFSYPIGKKTESIERSMRCSTQTSQR